MKYSDRDKLVEDLRELADFIEARGHKLPIKLYSPLSVISRFYESDDISPKLQMIRAAKNMGSAKKDWRSSDFELRKFMKNSTVELRFETQRSNVCTKRVIGTVEKPKHAYVEIPGETVTEEVVEWDCDPLLA